MYRHGFGDCFLLQFFEGDVRKQTMLIDCGLKLNDSVPGITLADVRDDIQKQLKGNDTSASRPKLDILVVTHEHWDHVSGFHPEEELYDDFQIGKIWMAWTENPDDEDAKVLNKGLRKRIKALKIAADRLKARSVAHARFYSQFAGGENVLAARENFTSDLEEVLHFFGPLGVEKTISGISVKDKYTISMDTQKAIDHIRSLSKGESGIRYCDPGDLIQDKTDLPGVRIFVLGPPKNKLLTKDAPSKGPKKEVYFGANSSIAGLVDGLLAMGDPSSATDESRPFGEIPAMRVEEAKKDDYYKQTYFKRTEAWRTVEDDWLDMAGSLAMQMDSDTNNTSLALAIQLPNGKVLLFPGDAQVGNWLSWHDHEWKIKNGSTTEIINATALLNATVLYKVGHHASHNATLRELGLELMTSEELVAMVPEKEKQYNGIPFKPLVRRLREKTKGRLLFSADKNYRPENVKAKKPDGLSATEWEQFKKQLVVDKLFIEYTVR
jgi:beta-lactamase superfamily II metal-dependent hydrolase